MKVYVILSGDCDDYQYAGVRKTEEKANKFIEELKVDFGDIFYIQEEEI